MNQATPATVPRSSGKSRSASVEGCGSAIRSTMKPASAKAPRAGSISFARYGGGPPCGLLRGGHHRVHVSRRASLSGDGRRLESLDHEVDAQRQLPEDLRDRRDELRCGAWLDDVEQHGGPRDDDQRTSDQAQDRHAPRHEAGAVHQVTQDQPVPDADDPARPEQERPVVDRDERPAERDERARAAWAPDVLAQRHDGQEADEADGDEGALNDAGGDVAESEALVLPFE